MDLYFLRRKGRDPHRRSPSSRLLCKATGTRTRVLRCAPDGLVGIATYQRLLEGFGVDAVVHPGLRVVQRDSHRRYRHDVRDQRAACAVGARRRSRDDCAQRRLSTLLDSQWSRSASSVERDDCVVWRNASRRAHHQDPRARRGESCRVSAAFQRDEPVGHAWRSVVEHLCSHHGNAGGQCGRDPALARRGRCSRRRGRDAGHTDRVHAVCRAVRAAGTGTRATLRRYSQCIERGGAHRVAACD